jgi:hypothetical protein
MLTRYNIMNHAIISRLKKKHIKIDAGTINIERDWKCCGL